MRNFFEIKEITIRTSNFGELLDNIKTGIAQGYYLFLTVDRYFYPSVGESGKVHFLHDVFIHGYNDVTNSFHTLEDYILPGFMNYYVLPYSAVEISLHHLLHSGKDVSLFLYKLKEESITFLNNQIAPIKTGMNMATQLLEDKKTYNGCNNLIYHCGLSSLNSFTDEIEGIYDGLENIIDFGMRILSFQHVHKRNYEFILFIQEHLSKSVETEKLGELYKLLQREWEIYKNKSIRFLDAKARKGSFNTETSKVLKESLIKIKSLEEMAANDLIRVCQQLI